VDCFYVVRFQWPHPQSRGLRNQQVQNRVTIPSIDLRARLSHGLKSG
jgi:hypothetical protein